MRAQQNLIKCRIKSAPSRINSAFQPISCAHFFYIGISTAMTIVDKMQNGVPPYMVPRRVSVG